MTKTSVAKDVVIRPAEDGDQAWVAELMNQALSPYYGGDHRAHAVRIFDTHIKGGTDYVGHFSSGQYMYIAWLNGQRIGMVHLVEKKQGTVKISPLIVDPDNRGSRGIGSLLLDYAENFAKSLGARQLYCTVASTNESALGFFLHKGFRITGTAPNHYMKGVAEHMLYKELVDDSDLNAPNISVVPFDPELHAAGVREIILRRLQGDFLGVDNGWVDALFAGYERRNGADINDKYKIIFVAESNGKVVGVAGATPKKGDPIKLMPLVADSEAAFEALIIDLQSLLVDYGHKLYLHLVPESWQIKCLQRHSWSVEGVMPDAYSPGSVVQQWGIVLKKGEDEVKQMRIKGPYFDAMREGLKTLEVRVGYDSIKRLKPGQSIEFQTSRNSGTATVKAVRVYESLELALNREPWRKIMPFAESQQDTLRNLKAIYPPDKERMGVYVIEIEWVH